MLKLVENHEGDIDRALYTVRFEGVIYVLHAFQKKSTSGIRTAATDVALIKKRFRRAREDHEAEGGEDGR